MGYDPNLNPPAMLAAAQELQGPAKRIGRIGDGVATALADTKARGPIFLSLKYKVDAIARVCDHAGTAFSKVARKLEEDAQDQIRIRAELARAAEEQKRRDELFRPGFARGQDR